MEAAAELTSRAPGLRRAMAPRIWVHRSGAALRPTEGLAGAQPVQPRVRQGHRVTRADSEAHPPAARVEAQAAQRARAPQAAQQGRAVRDQLARAAQAAQQGRTRRAPRWPQNSRPRSPSTSRALRAAVISVRIASRCPVATVVSSSSPRIRSPSSTSRTSTSTGSTQTARARRAPARARAAHAARAARTDDARRSPEVVAQRSPPSSGHPLSSGSGAPGPLCRIARSHSLTLSRRGPNTVGSAASASMSRVGRSAPKSSG